VCFLCAPRVASSSFLPGYAHEFEVLPREESLTFVYLLPIDEGDGPRTNIERLTEDLSGLTDGLPRHADGQGVYSMDHPDRATALCVVWRRERGTQPLHLLQSFAAQRFLTLRTTRGPGEEHCLNSIGRVEGCQPQSGDREGPHLSSESLRFGNAVHESRQIGGISNGTTVLGTRLDEVVHRLSNRQFQLLPGDVEGEEGVGL
jgi:hypothetical protein